jgi:hypothetical protein
MKKRTAIAVAIVLGVALLSPIISRCGRWKTVHQWEAPQSTFGLNRKMYLSVQSFHAFVDPLALYEESRVIVTDGGYAYIVEADLNFFPEVSESKVEWNTKGVSITFPSGVVIQIPRDRVVEQIGT